MTMAALSYAHGASDVPLIGETIGANFDRAVAQWGDRPALVVRQQDVRWTYRELGERVDAFAAGLERAERELPETIETRLEWAVVVGERPGA